MTLLAFLEAEEGSLIVVHTRFMPQFVKRRHAKSRRGAG